MKRLLLLAMLLPFAGFAQPINTMNNPNQPGYQIPSQQRMQTQMQSQQIQQKGMLNQQLQTQTRMQQQHMENQINTNTQSNVGIKDLQSVKIVAPPIKEQADIATFLDTETARLDELTAEATHGIALLKERRSALISAAVTGKIDVREANNQ